MIYILLFVISCCVFLTLPDSKSGEGDFVPVRFRPSVPNMGFRVVQRNQWLREF